MFDIDSWRYRGIVLMSVFRASLRLTGSKMLLTVSAAVTKTDICAAPREGRFIRAVIEHTPLTYYN